MTSTRSTIAAISVFTLTSATIAAFSLGSGVGPGFEAGVGLDDHDQVLRHWGAAGGPGDLDGNGAVDAVDLRDALERERDAMRAGGVDSFRGIVLEPYIGSGWVANGYVGLTTYRLYAEFDDDEDGVISGYGISGLPLSFASSDGIFHNDLEFGSHTAPLDLRPTIWSNQWDTYVTINATESVGDQTTLSPDFDTTSHGLESTFTSENIGWFVTPDQEQIFAIDGRVLLAQFTVAAGQHVSGIINLLTVNHEHSIIVQLPFSSDVDPFAGACCVGSASCSQLTPKDCATIGGTFLGAGIPCATQLIETDCFQHDEFFHCLTISLICPETPQPSGGGLLIDAWASSDGGGGDPSSLIDFGDAPIPAGFFGAGTDPFVSAVALEGLPLGVVDLTPYGGVPTDFGDASTLVLRDRDPFDRCELPSADARTAAIDLIAMRLESVSPLIVTRDGGQDPELWNLGVSLSVVRPDGGTVTATMSHCNGGTYAVEDMSFQPKYTFTKVDDPGVVLELDTGVAGDAPFPLDLEEGDWVLDLDPALGSGSPFPTAFHPGIRDDDASAACDCNENLVRDKCDIEDESSLDVDGSGVPDECECLGDVDGNGVTDVRDILRILTFWGPCDGCTEDIDRSGAVGQSDIVALVASWGVCD